MYTSPDEELLTKHAERAVFEVFCRESITAVLQHMNPPVPTKLDIYNSKKRETETILAKSINNNALIEKFYALDGSDLDRGSLDNIQEKATRYVYFLTHTHKQKYLYVKSNDELEWLSMVASVSHVMKSAEWRYQEKRYKDQEACQRMARLIVRREENEAVAKGWGHARKHGEDPNETLRPVFDEFQGRVNDTFFLPYKNELPSLPPGIIHPLAWLTKRAGGQ